MYQEQVKTDKRSLKMHTDNIIEQGTVLLEQGNPKEALNRFQSVLSVNPQDVLASYNAGLACYTLGEIEVAIHHYQIAIQGFPQFIQAHHNLAQAYAAQNNLPSAIDAYRMALTLNPEDFNSAYNLSLLYRKLGLDHEAIEAVETAIRAKPSSAAAFCLLGSIYNEQNQFEKALVCLEQALRCDPDLAQAHYNKGVVLQRMGAFEQGVDQYRKAMVCDPRYAPAHWLYRLTLPMIYENAGQIDHYRRKFSKNLELLVKSTRLETNDQKAFAMRGLQSTTNFFLQYQCRNDVALQKIYGRFAQRVMAANFPQWATKRQMPRPKHAEKIRIGYVSTFMHNHTVGTFLLGWLKNHTPGDFDIHGYYVGKKVDGLTEQLRNCCKHFHQFAGNLEAAAGRIASDDLHILIYTDIGMDPLTTQLAALRLAPVQCKGWGHPITTGLPTVDYYLSSDLMEPYDARACYSERLIRLPNLALCYQPPALPENPKKRRQLGLPLDRFVFLSTQSIFKYLPQHDDIYPRIARQVPGACFVFIGNKSRHATERFLNRLRSAFDAFGLDADDFCVVTPKLNFNDFLSLNLAADVLLDTLEWSGGKTTLEALTCELPVVTLPGRFMRGRHAYAMLRMIDAPDTIAADKDAYCAIAARLANDRPFFRRVKHRIASNRNRLYDDKHFMKALETFYRSVIEQSHAMTVDERIAPQPSNQ